MTFSVPTGPRCQGAQEPRERWLKCRFSGPLGVFFSLSKAKLGLWDILTSFRVILTQVCQQETLMFKKRFKKK